MSSRMNTRIYARRTEQCRSKPCRLISQDYEQDVRATERTLHSLSNLYIRVHVEQARSGYLCRVRAAPQTRS